MNNRIFNTTFEVSIRVLLYLSAVKNQSLTLDNLVTADFITTYSHEFGLSELSLHGNHDFTFTEFSLRRNIVQNAIKALVLDNMIKVCQSTSGFSYSITSQGQTFCNDLKSDYAIEYRIHAERTKKYMKTKTQKELLNLITQEAVKSNRKG